VTNTLDDGSVNSLRWAITQANADTDPLSNINFNIPGTGVQTISLTDALPAITHPVIINGYTQPGSSPNTHTMTDPDPSDNDVRLITLDGSLLSGGSYNMGTYDNYSEASAALDAVIGPTGLIIVAGNSTVTGLVIQNFSADYFAFFPGFELGPGADGAAIRLTSSGNLVAGNYMANTPNGVSVDNAPYNTIGGITPAARNVITNCGLNIARPGATGNLIEGNFIGTDGSYNLGGTVFINGASYNTIGGSDPLARNVIGGSDAVRIVTLGDTANNNEVEGNYISLNASGTAALIHSFPLGEGVWIFNGGGVTDNNRIEGNVIAGYGADVIFEEGPGSEETENVVDHNYLGTNASGTSAIHSGNGLVDESSSGGNMFSNNLISGCGDGILIGTDAGDLVDGNLIGTDASGSHPIPNGTGVAVFDNQAISGNTIAFNGVGTYVAGSNNVISGNTVENSDTGIDVAGSNNEITGNTIAYNNGVAADSGSGVRVGYNGKAIGNRIEGNTFYGNQGPGVWIPAGPLVSSGGFFGAYATGNSISDNSIHDNGGLGIDLGDIPFDSTGHVTTNPSQWSYSVPDGVTPNNSHTLTDSQGQIVGPNHFQNYPVLALATVAAAATTVTGTLNSVPSTTFRVEFFASVAADPSGHGQGQTYLGYATVTTDPSGNASFTATGLASLPAGQSVLSATATRLDGQLNPTDTSEFSADLQVSQDGTVTAQANTAAAADAFIAAVNASPATSAPVTVVLNLGAGTYTDLTPAPPAGVTLVINGNGTTTTIVGQSPALTVGSGTVVVTGVTLTTATDAPTILVTGGHLTLRNDTIQESTGSSDPAIQVTGGTVDLGTTPSSGGNTINLNGPGAFALNTTATPISAVGDVFTVNGAPLTPSSLSGIVWEDFNNDGQVDFGEKGIAGVTITLTGTDDLGNPVTLTQTTDADGTYIFLGLRPGTYKVTETPPAGYLQGIDSIGTAGGSLSATDQFLVPLGVQVDGLNYNFGELPTATGPVQHGQAAGIGFWNNKNGQALIKALPVVTNPDGSVTSVANWLAATLPHMFGIFAGSNNLTCQSNAFVAALFQQDFVMKGVKLDAQVLATALSVYATNATLDSTSVAAHYGFTVSGAGLGATMVNVGSNGDAFGVANNANMTVMDLLLATDTQAINGVLYSGNTTRRTHANAVFSLINDTGGV
jgi:hypothetical protein